MGQAEGTYEERLKAIEDFISTIFKYKVQTLYSYYSYPFVDEYTKYETSDLSFLVNHQEKVSPEDCKKAYELGGILATPNN